MMTKTVNIKPTVVLLDTSEPNELQNIFILLENLIDGVPKANVNVCQLEMITVKNKKKTLAINAYTIYVNCENTSIKLF